MRKIVLWMWILLERDEKKANIFFFVLFRSVDMNAQRIHKHTYRRHMPSHRSRSTRCCSLFCGIYLQQFAFHNDARINVMTLGPFVPLSPSAIHMSTQMSTNFIRKEYQKVWYGLVCALGICVCSTVSWLTIELSLSLCQPLHANAISLGQSTTLIAVVLADGSSLYALANQQRQQWRKTMNFIALQNFSILSLMHAAATTAVRGISVCVPVCGWGFFIQVVRCCGYCYCWRHSPQWIICENISPKRTERKWVCVSPFAY